MIDSAKRKALILFGLVMLLTVILAASLPQLDLQPGMPLPRLEEGRMMLAPIEEEPLVVISVSEFVRTPFALVLVGSILYVTYKLLRGSDWRNLGSFIQPLMIVVNLLTTSLEGCLKPCAVHPAAPQFRSIFQADSSR